LDEYSLELHSLVRSVVLNIELLAEPIKCQFGDYIDLKRGVFFDFKASTPPFRGIEVKLEELCEILETMGFFLTTGAFVGPVLSLEPN
jgi:hypothetical protein